MKFLKDMIKLRRKLVYMYMIDSAFTFRNFSCIVTCCIQIALPHAVNSMGFDGLEI